MASLPEPEQWKDLSKEVYQGWLSLADPRRSGSANTMNNIILQAHGWEKGMEILTAIGGNTRAFTHSSSDPIKAVVSGDAAIAMAIDFYATAKIADLGTGNLGFVLPEGKTVLDPDPVAILKGAPHQKVAQRFIDYLLSSDAQQLWMLPRGAKGGPEHRTLARFAVNSVSYDQVGERKVVSLNPFTSKGFFAYDAELAGKLQGVINDFIGAMIIDNHDRLKQAWKRALKDGVTDQEMAALGAVPLSLRELEELAEKWHDNVLRNKKINEWVAFAQAKYKTGISH